MKAILSLIFPMSQIFLSTYFLIISYHNWIFWYLPLFLFLGFSQTYLSILAIDIFYCTCWLCIWINPSFRAIADHWCQGICTKLLCGIKWIRHCEWVVCHCLWFDVSGILARLTDSDTADMKEQGYGLVRSEALMKILSFLSVFEGFLCTRSQEASFLIHICISQC